MSLQEMGLRIARITEVAKDIRSFELMRPDQSQLPGFTAGSHVTVRVPNGELRKYSLCNDPAERHRYVITVKREASGRGGSVSLIDNARAGDILPTSPPDNAFPLEDSAQSYIFIAGGIGITPILSMIRFVDQTTKPWKLIYLTHSPERTAYLQELAVHRCRDKLRVHHSFGDPSRSFDLWPVLERPTGAHIYCCGPKRLMESVRDMSGHWPSFNVHFESFIEGGTTGADDQPFQVKASRSGRVFEVPPGSTILSVLRGAGYELPSSCESGTCGTCKTHLLAGEPDHRDMVLLPEERSSRIMICVSRAKSNELVLDL